MKKVSLSLLCRRHGLIETIVFEIMIFIVSEGAVVQQCSIPFCLLYLEQSTVCSIIQRTLITSLDPGSKGQERCPVSQVI